VLGWLVLGGLAMCSQVLGWLVLLLAGVGLAGVGLAGVVID